MLVSENNELVLYFGGDFGELNAYALSDAISSFTDAIREVYTQANFGYDLELFVEDIGHGSFKIKLFGKSGSVNGAFTWSAEHLFVPLLISFFAIHYMTPDPVQINISEDSVVIDTGNGEKIVVPRNTHDAAEKIPAPKKIHKHMNQALDALEKEERVDSFGFSLDMEKEPVVKLPRVKWGRVREKLYDEEKSEGSRLVEEEAHLSVLKVVFSNKNRRWDFVWRGVKISAQIQDIDFITQVMSRSYVIGNGDVLHCTLAITQEWQDDDNVWINKKYTITKVVEFLSGDESKPLI